MPIPLDHRPIVVPMEVAVTDAVFDMDVVCDETFDMELDVAIQVGSGEYYDGPYEFTPSAEEQAVQIVNLMASENIIINPIPSNYGLITWNGSVLTVS